jgi:hypothetical protein
MLGGCQRIKTGAVLESAVVVFSYLLQSDGALMTQLLFARDEVIVARVLEIVINVDAIRP